MAADARGLRRQVLEQRVSTGSAALTIGRESRRHDATREHARPARLLARPHETHPLAQARARRERGVFPVRSVEVDRETVQAERVVVLEQEVSKMEVAVPVAGIVQTAQGYGDRASRDDVGIDARIRIEPRECVSGSRSIHGLSLIHI